MVTKTRIIDEGVPYLIDGVFIRRRGTRVGSETMVDSSTTGSQRTDVPAVDAFLANPTNRSDFHKALRESNKTAGDAGLASFRVDRTIESYSTLDFVAIPYKGGPTNTIKGMTCRRPTSELPSGSQPSPLSAAQMKVAGQTLYHRALPMKDQADLGVMIGEIATNPVRALTLPTKVLSRANEVQRNVRSTGSLRRAAEQRHRQIKGLPLEEARLAADDYLAYIFGVRPNVGTLDDLASSLSKSRQTAEVVSRNGYRRIRRRRSNPPVTTMATWHRPNHWTLPERNGNAWGLLGPAHAFTETYSRTWWSGSFRMATADTDSWLDKCDAFFKRIDYLTGIGLDVRAAWDLIPFSFMADWFANTGDFIENRQVVADYNIACEYGYVMNHTKVTKTFIGTGLIRPYNGNPFTGTSTEGSLSYTYLKETKQRARCSTFGFYTDFSNLNPQQWGALTALGLTFSAGNPPRIRT